ncbi:MAG: hypothetical protein H6835_08715 [Planctomycetes bacterium]|nr:hypothetical protein [Planctomycetota bacterium]
MKVLPEVGLDIAPGEALRFGMSRDAVREVLGEPEQVSDGDEDGALTEAWYYWTRGLALSFDEEVDWRLCAIELTAATAELDGQRPIGTTFEQTRAAMPGVAIEWDGDEMQPASVDAWSLNLWIEDDKVTSLQWSVGFDANDEERWP